MEFQHFSDPSLLAMADARGSLRLRQCEVDANEQVDTTRIAGYEECRQMYAHLEQRATSAKEALFAAMGNPKEVPMGGGYTLRASWHYREQVLPDGQAVPVAYEVTVIQQDGVFSGMSVASGLHNPVNIKTHVIHRPSYDLSGKETKVFTGEMSGFVLFDADATEVSLAQEKLRLNSFDTLKALTIKELQGRARREALEPWADKFLAVDAAMDCLSDTDAKALGLSAHTDKSFLRLLGPKPSDRQAALNLLDKAFGEDILTSLYRMLDTPIASFTAKLEQCGATEIFRWVTQHVTEIRQNIGKHTRETIVFGFYDEYVKRHNTEIHKVAEIESLAKALAEGTRNVNSCAPRCIRAQA